MSIIAAVQKKNSISLACDTQTSRGSMKILDTYKVDSTKIYKFNDTLIGIAGWYAIQQIFVHVLQSKPEVFDFSSRIHIFESLLKMQKLIEDEYFVETSERKDQPVSSNQLTAIIVNQHGLFDIGSYREVNQFAKFWAIGSGQDFAIGAMHALYDKKYSSSEIAEAGVKAACDFDDGCSAPIQVETIKF